ncbi:MAG: hypothetical protein V1647_01855 [Pseudomonadota bacterium]
MSVTIKSRGLVPLFSSSMLLKKGLRVSIVNERQSNEVSVGGIRLFPYELPVFNLSEYAGFKELKGLFLNSVEPVGIIYEGKRFNFSYEYLPKDLIEALRDAENKVHFFGRGLTHFYKKHKLSKEQERVLDSVIFLLSGTARKHMPVNYAAKIILGALNGISIPYDGVYTLRNAFLKVLSEKLEREKLPHSNFVIEDRIKQKYKDKTIKLFSIYIKIPFDLIPEAMNRWLLVIDEEALFIVRHFFIGTNAIIRVSCVENSLYKQRALEMIDLVREIIPLSSQLEYFVYPNPLSKDFESELSKSFTNLEQGDTIYQNRTPWYTGFDSQVKQGVKDAEKILRSYQD